MDKWMNKWMDGQMDGRFNGRTDRRMDGQTDGWMDRWTDGKISNLMEVFINIQDLLVTVYENGRLLKEYSFDEVRQRVEISLIKKT